MRYVDANVFIYAMLKPKRKLSKQEINIKKKAKNILRSVENGEEVATSVVQVSEAVNILSSVSNVSLANMFLDKLFSLPNIKILHADKKAYLLANELSKKIEIDVNDALAYALMRDNQITEIYSFDKGFDKVIGIKRLEVI